MASMWFMEEGNLSARVVVFSLEVMREYLASGYKITGEYQIQLVEGSNYLPDYVGDE